MIVTDELLLSLVDGELDAATAAKVRQAVAADPQLKADLAVFDDSARLLRSALQLGPTPERLIAAINAAPVGTVVDAPTQPESSVVTPFLRRSRRPSAPVFWGAIAASLVLGAMIGAQFNRPAGQRGAPEVMAYTALPTGAEQQDAHGTTVRILGSYQTDVGLCREILSEAADYLRHDVVCRTSEGWKLALSLSAPAEQGFIPASDGLTAALNGYLDVIGAGSALAPAAEEAVLAEQ